MRNTYYQPAAGSAVDTHTELEDPWIEDPWPTLDEALVDARFVAERAQEIYGEALDSVWLYGSRARGEHRNVSDLDLLLVTSGEAGKRDPRYRELSDIVGSQYQPTSKFGFVHMYLCHSEQFENWDTMFFRNVRAEALRVA